ncbi:MAG TPA: LuxR C-terminal-related transcriptional regulator [Cytophagaceae bacterium]|jgi:DNA-binding CsgD family transcriptional regulator|nr:LuxR C-terminal-related transcriptional regulator [Cytophagaceae bacterium]
MKSKTDWASDFYGNLLELIDNTLPEKVTSNNRSDPSGIFGNKEFNSLFESAPGIVCIYNFQSKQYEFFSKNVKNILGYDAEDYLNGGLAFGMSTFHEAHAKIFSNRILPLMLQNINQYAISKELKNVSFDYSFKVRTKEGEYLWFLQQMNFIETDEHGYPFLSVLFMINIDSVKTDNYITFKVNKKDEREIFQTIFTQSYVVDEEFLFSERELEILQLLSEGKSSMEIANLLFISKHTVNTHRQNMLEKTSAKNTIELLKIALKDGLV